MDTFTYDNVSGRLRMLASTCSLRLCPFGIAFHLQQKNIFKKRTPVHEMRSFLSFITTTDETNQQPPLLNIYKIICFPSFSTNINAVICLLNALCLSTKFFLFYPRHSHSCRLLQFVIFLFIARLWNKKKKKSSA